MKRAHMYPPQDIFFDPPDYVSFIYQKYQFLSPN